MEDVLRWSLLVVGGCIIVGVAVHGIWISRKNNEADDSASEPKQSLEPNYANDEQWQPGSLDDGNVEPDIDFKINVDDAPDDGIHDHEPISSADQFDDLGIGNVRVVSTNKSNTDTATQTNDADSVKATSAEPTIATEQTTEPDASKIAVTKDEQRQSPAAKQSSGKIYASVVTQPKPEFTEKLTPTPVQSDKPVSDENSEQSSQVKPVNIGKVANSDLATTRTSTSKSEVINTPDVPEPPPFLLKKDVGQGDPVTSVNTSTGSISNDSVTPIDASQSEQQVSSRKESLTEQARNLVKRKRSEGSRKRKEPKLSEDQMRIDFDDEDKKQAPSQTSEASQEQQANAKGNEPLQEVLVLNVKVADNTPIAGAALLPMLLTLGFKFGDQDIFHRHVNSNGKGPVLFSLANMFKPGNFDIDNLETFSTQGVSLFMILPIEGDPHQVFNMMHNAARKIADEFDAQVYDGKRALLTKQSLQQYVERIREFERQRMLQR